MTRGAFGCLRTRGKLSGGNLAIDLYLRELNVSTDFCSDLKLPSTVIDRPSCRGLEVGAVFLPFGLPWWVIQLTSMPCICSMMGGVMAAAVDSDNKDGDG